MNMDAFTIKRALYLLIEFIEWMIVVRALMSWFPNSRGTKLNAFVYKVTEPIIGPIRDLMFKFFNSPIDFSPVIALLLLQAISGFVLRVI
jgi:YggT family protein